MKEQPYKNTEKTVCLYKVIQVTRCEGNWAEAAGVTLTAVKFLC